MNNLRKLIIAGTIVAVAAILVLIYIVGFKNPTTEIKDNNQQQTGNQTQKPGDQSEEPNTTENPQSPRTYTDTVNKFSLQYPGILKAGNEDFTYIPDGKNNKIAIDSSFVHEINTQYCALSGECRPTTQDFGFNLVVIPSPLSDVQKSLSGSAVPLDNQQFGSVKALTMSMGVEGEGRNYFFISLANNKTLMLEQAYMDENILIGYKNNPNFMKFAQQNKIMSEIITSIKFLK